MLFKRLAKLQITKDFLGMSFIGIFSRFLSAFALIILIRYISIEDFGKFSILKTTLNHSVVFLLAGIGQTLVKFSLGWKIRYKYHYQILVDSLLRRLFFSIATILIVVIIFSSKISLVLLDDNSLWWLIIVMTAALLPLTIVGFTSFVCIGSKSYDKYNFNIFQNSLAQSSAIFLGLLSGSWQVIITLVVISSFISGFLSYKILKKLNISISSFVNFRRSKSRISSHKIALKITNTLFLGTFAVPLSFILMNIILLNKSSHYELGFFTAAYSLINLLVIFQKSFNNILVGKLLDRVDKYDIYNNVYHSLMFGILIFTIPIMFPELFSIFLGKKYEDNLFFFYISTLSMISFLFLFSDSLTRIFLKESMVYINLMFNFIWISLSLLLFISQDDILWRTTSILFSLIIALMLILIPIYKNSIIDIRFIFLVFLIILISISSDFFISYASLLTKIIYLFIKFSLLILIFLKVRVLKY
tara:strand:+ start:10246 stop:11667 length:1422 start_codon:yes stop_codon:yes gene_type:complete